MTKADKAVAIEELKGQFENASFFYLADSSTLTVEQINNFRRMCFEKGVEVKVVKNTLAKKALESLENDSYQPLYDVFKGPTTLMFSETANVPAKLIKEFRDKKEIPALKAAYIDSDVFIGDENLDALIALKSKEEMLGEVIGLLQSPIKNLLGQLQSGGQTISGLLKALEERAS